MRSGCCIQHCCFLSDLWWGWCSHCPLDLGFIHTYWLLMFQPSFIVLGSFETLWWMGTTHLNHTVCKSAKYRLQNLHYNIQLGLGRSPFRLTMARLQNWSPRDEITSCFTTSRPKTLTSKIITGSHRAGSLYKDRVGICSRSSKGKDGLLSELGDTFLRLDVLAHVFDICLIFKSLALLVPVDQEILLFSG